MIRPFIAACIAVPAVIFACQQGYEMVLAREVENYTKAIWHMSWMSSWISAIVAATKLVIDD